MKYANLNKCNATMAKYENLSWGERSLVKNIITDLSEKYKIDFNEALLYLMGLKTRQKKKGKRRITKKKKSKPDPVIVSDTDSERQLAVDYKEDVEIIDTKVEEFIFKKKKMFKKDKMFLVDGLLNRKSVDGLGATHYIDGHDDPEFADPKFWRHCILVKKGKFHCKGIPEPESIKYFG